MFQVRKVAVFISDIVGKACRVDLALSTFNIQHHSCQGALIAEG
jgi:hypothetical protein